MANVMCSFRGGPKRGAVMELATPLPSPCLFPIRLYPPDIAPNQAAYMPAYKVARYRFTGYALMDRDGNAIAVYEFDGVHGE